MYMTGKSVKPTDLDGSAIGLKTKKISESGVSKKGLELILKERKIILVEWELILTVEENDRINTIVRFQAVELESGSAAAEVKSVVTSRLRSIDDRVDRILRQMEQLSAHLSSPFLLALGSSLRTSFAAAGRGQDDLNLVRLDIHKDGAHFRPQAQVNNALPPSPAPVNFSLSQIGSGQIQGLSPQRKLHPQHAADVEGSDQKSSGKTLSAPKNRLVTLKTLVQSLSSRSFVAYLQHDRLHADVKVSHDVMEKEDESPTDDHHAAKNTFSFVDSAAKHWMVPTAVVAAITIILFLDLTMRSAASRRSSYTLSSMSSLATFRSSFRYTYQSVHPEELQKASQAQTDIRTRLTDCWIRISDLFSK